MHSSNFFGRLVADFGRLLRRICSDLGQGQRRFLMRIDVRIEGLVEDFVDLLVDVVADLRSSIEGLLLFIRRAAHCLLLQFQQLARGIGNGFGSFLACIFCRFKHLLRALVDHFANFFGRLVTHICNCKGHLLQQFGSFLGAFLQQPCTTYFWKRREHGEGWDGAK